MRWWFRSMRPEFSVHAQNACARCFAAHTAYGYKNRATHIPYAMDINGRVGCGCASTTAGASRQQICGCARKSRTLGFVRCVRVVELWGCRSSRIYASSSFSHVINLCCAAVCCWLFRLMRMNRTISAGCDVRRCDVVLS